jgi:hypothetical protein
LSSPCADIFKKLSKRWKGGTLCLCLLIRVSQVRILYGLLKIPFSFLNYEPFCHLSILLIHNIDNLNVSALPFTKESLVKVTMKEDFVKVDLHIHTPASSCYKGAKTDDEYLQIIRKARAKGLSIIAITDHNSIEGYRTILKIKEGLVNEKRSLSAITDSKQAKSRLKSLESDLEIFNNILLYYLV